MGTLNTGVGLNVNRRSGRLEVLDTAGAARVGWINTTGRTGFIYQRTTNQSINNNSTTAISFATQTTDTDAYQTGGGPWTTFTIPAGLGGIYSGYLAVYSGDATAARKLADILINSDTANPLRGTHYGESGVVVPLPGRALVATDTISAQIYQNSGGAVNYTARLEFWRIGP